MFTKITKIVIFTATLFPIHNLKAINEPQKTIFLWDLHDVVLIKDTPRIAKISCKNIFSARIIRGLQRPLIRKFFTLIHNQSKGIETSAEEFIWIAHQYNHPALVQMIKDLQNSQKINPGILPIIKDLKARGYTHHVGSNIGESCFKQLIDPILYPQFKELFSYFDVTAPQVVSFNTNNPEIVIKKPHAHFFTTYLQNNAIDLATTRVIFIDDKLPNITTAKKLGFTTIHFKNPKQLRAELQSLNIIG